MVGDAGVQQPAESLCEMQTVWCCRLVTIMIDVRCNVKVGGLVIPGTLCKWRSSSSLKHDSKHKKCNLKKKIQAPLP